MPTLFKICTLLLSRYHVPRLCLLSGQSSTLSGLPYRAELVIIPQVTFAIICSLTRMCIINKSISSTPQPFSQLLFLLSVHRFTQDAYQQAIWFKMQFCGQSYSFITTFLPGSLICLHTSAATTTTDTDTPATTPRTTNSKTQERPYLCEYFLQHILHKHLTTHSDTPACLSSWGSQ